MPRYTISETVSIFEAATTDTPTIQYSITDIMELDNYGELVHKQGDKRYMCTCVERKDAEHLVAALERYDAWVDED